MQNIIYEVSKQKTSIKGFWKDTKGKVYIDNIKLFEPKNICEFESKLYLLFNSGELAIFVKSKQKAFIINKDDTIIELSKNIQFKREKLSFNEIKDLLNLYNGITVIKEDNHFIIDIWQA